MARGWESKSVEDQVNEHDAESLRGNADAARLSADERTKQSKLNSLQLSRTRIMNQLAAAKNTAHRTMLERALAALDEQIAGAGESG